MSKYLRRIFAPLAVLIVLVFFIGYQSNAFGVPAKRLESFSRDNQSIPAEWLCLQEGNDNVAALLFFPPDKSSAIYSIYYKGSGLSLGYHARARGFMSSIQAEVCEFHYSEQNMLILLSLNRPGISQAEVKQDGMSQMIALDAQEPFVLVLPLNAQVTLIDELEQPRNELRSVVTI